MKKVLITGGSKGIGLATTKLFVRNGFDVFVLDKVPINDQRLVKNPKVEFIQVDLTKLDKLDKIVKRHKDIDILINNAGILVAKTYNQYTEKDKESIIRLNIEAPVKLISLLGPTMASKGKGRIVNVSSVNGKLGHSDIWYGITKAGIINMTKSFSKIFGPKGVLINCVAPGPVSTDMLAIAPPERVRRLIESSILSRAATPEEIAKVIYWLGTESPDYVNGITIDVNNGIRL